jgi:hypothetical protein
MRAVLSTKLPVEHFAVFAEMAWFDRRPELGELCRTAINQDDHLSAATVQAALPGLPEAGAHNVVLWCRMLGLCDPDGGLTELGRDVAATDLAPVPEQGVYGFWAADHPLLGRRILMVERLTSNRDHRFDAIGPLPMVPDRNVAFRSVAPPGDHFVLRDLPTQHKKPGCIPRPNHTTCQLTWSMDFSTSQSSWQLSGRIGASRTSLAPIDHEPEEASLDLWRLMATWGADPLTRVGQWSTDERRLAVALDGLSAQEQDSFLKTVELKTVGVTGKGIYDTATLSDIPIGPSSDSDAQTWALSRLTRTLTDDHRYRSRDALRHLFADLTEGTPLEPFLPTLPGHQVLIGGTLYSKAPDVFWGLAAPVDLAPYPITTQTLDALTIGAPGHTPNPPGAPDIISIPYRSGWPMRRLADRLVQGIIPKRILLCDRYVRGEGNLAALELLVAALREIGPAAAFEVWTEQQEADFDRIAAITGTTPQSYVRRFGRNWPHDRYLVVQPTEGSAFGWHLSNSPLHARATSTGADPSTPLRWKDFQGVKNLKEELMPAFHRWLSGGAP